MGGQREEWLAWKTDERREGEGRVTDIWMPEYAH